MAEFASPFSILTLLMLSFVFSGEAVVTNEKNWCVAKATAEDPALQSALDYACARVDCSEIQPGGSCYEPNNLFSHASYAMNLSTIRTQGNKPQVVTLMVLA
ncbi:hypothetical protein SLEP1_g6226 [Rubroshorea leprosula]|uniref:X8 domain-containing protein n=1 Tax=Rubroshorea leprosula TaxID=152421 RepID=A0AAV5HUJ9_9ROSI|nr:hypothetical protein SLEP1_g6226 [Rubroshorea leprosula]